MTPVSRASLGTKCAGIRLQIWPRSENFPAVGLRCVLFFIPRLVAGIKPVSQLFFYPKQSTPQDASENNYMSKQTTATKPNSDPLTADVEGYDSLTELALDLRWSWNHATDEIWRKLDPALWELTQNPWVVYAQGLALLAVASDKYEHAIDLEAVARIWGGGCIIRSGLLENIGAAFRVRRDLPNLLLDPALSHKL